MATATVKKSVRELVVSVVEELARTKKSFASSDISCMTLERRDECSETIFLPRDNNYSEALEDAITVMLISNQILINPFNSCKLVTPDSLEEILKERKKNL